MIHDKLANLMYYAPILEHIDQINEVLATPYEVGTYQIGRLSFEVAEYVPSSYSGVFKAHDWATTLVIMLEGSELFALTYAERSKGAPKDDEGWITIEDSPIRTVVTAKEGMFTAFMPHEPYALGIAKENSLSRVKRIIILLEPSYNALQM